MNILFDIAHPADVHLFRNVRAKLIAHGHVVVFMARDKDVVVQLLDAYKIPYEKGTKAQKGLIALSFELIKWFFNAFLLIRKNKIELAVSLSSPSTAWSAWLQGVPHIMFNDTETGVAQLRMARPATKRIYTPECLSVEWGPKQIRYKGIHDLAYLRPEVGERRAEGCESVSLLVGESEVGGQRSEGGESVGRGRGAEGGDQRSEVREEKSEERSQKVEPFPRDLVIGGLAESRTNGLTDSSSSALPGLRRTCRLTDYAIVRFVSWGASHDRGMKKTTTEFQKKICDIISARMRVYISAEGELPDELKQYRLSVSPDKLHKMMASAKLVVGDGATTATEAAVMGVPSIYISPFADSLGYCAFLEEYGLLTAVTDEGAALERIKELLDNPEFEKRANRVDRLFRETIDVVDFIVECCEREGVRDSVIR